MKVKVNYKDKVLKFDIPEETLEKLIKEQKSGWRNNDNEEKLYYAITSFGTVAEETYHDDELDQFLYNTGNSFSNKQLAENIARYQSLDRRIRRRIVEISQPIDWNNLEVKKYCCYYNHWTKKINIVDYNFLNFGVWACDTRDNMEKIIEEFNDELIWFFTEFEDRMD